MTRPDPVLIQLIDQASAEAYKHAGFHKSGSDKNEWLIDIGDTLADIAAELRDEL